MTEGTNLRSLLIEYFGEVSPVSVNYFSKSKTIRIFVRTKSRLPEREIEEFAEKLKNHLEFVADVQISEIVGNDDEISLLSYYEAAVEKAMVEKPRLKDALLAAPRRLHDGNVLNITVHNLVEYEKVKTERADSRIAKAYRELTAEEVKIVIHHGEEDSDEFIQKMDEFTSAQISETVKVVPEKKIVKSEAPATKAKVFNKEIKTPITKIETLQYENELVAIEGEVFGIDETSLSSGKTLLDVSVYDGSGSFGVKFFLKPEELEDVKGVLNKGSVYKFEGRTRFDTYSKETVIFGNKINYIGEIPERVDGAKEKRVELHLHTGMSDLDGITDVKKYIKRAAKWGHKAIGITDHGNVQAFPEAAEQGKASGVKILYGLEGYYYDDRQNVVDDIDTSFEGEFIAFDLETTGFSNIDDRIIEIGAVKIRNMEIVESFSELVDPGVKLSDEIIELTGITDDDLRGKRKIEEVLPDFLRFIGDSPLAAHNASFDFGFIRMKASDHNLRFENGMIDTLNLSRLLLKDMRRFRLNQVAKKLKISLDHHHRALDDATVAGKILIDFFFKLKQMGLEKVSEINSLADDSYHQLGRKNHIILYAKNEVGLKNLYKLVSTAHIDHFYRSPNIPASALEEFREGILVGSACQGGELYQAFLSNESDEVIEKIATKYDYFEIQPLDNNMFLLSKGNVKSVDRLKEINRSIYGLGKKMDKLVVATSDCHYIDPGDKIYRSILMAASGFKPDEDEADLFYRTTEEMLSEFSYLGRDAAREVVLDNTNAIADMMEDILPMPDGTFAPEIEGSDDELREICFRRAREQYGENLPEIVEKRLTRELDSIIGNGYAVMYIIAEKLVKKSEESGYLVGSRGSVGSSFAATMGGITEVNPLEPHYYCKKCQTSEFITNGSYGSGADLPDKICPECGEPYEKDGFEIPFESFLGFEGDKEPDIDLNFSPVVQGDIHKYTEVLFGKGYVFKAGTIGTIADKTAYGYVKKYYEEVGRDVSPREINRLLTGITGIKRTTGQHPGGIMVVPAYKDIYDFCPIQHPANDKSSGVTTTHFDYHAIKGRLLKLDILGHEVPSIIRQLEELTGISPLGIRLDDKETIEIFSSVDSLGIKNEQYKETVGTLGIPEFGTQFVRQMLIDTRPKTFNELIMVSGLSHGTDVWINNAQELVKNSITDFENVISTRDSIMTYLIHMGLPKKESFNIMEKVRKGKGLTEAHETLMRDHEVPEWYIDSCKKIKYMFPKAHAAAYVMMSFRIAYYKVHHPLEFYSSYFSTKVDDFDADIMVRGMSFVKGKLDEMRNSEETLSKKEQDMITVLEVVYEMYSRGYEFTRVELYESGANEFKVKGGKLLPPLRSISGVGKNAAEAIREEGMLSEFLSKEDMRKRTRVNRTAIDALDNHGCLKDLPEDNQLSISDFFNI